MQTNLFKGQLVRLTAEDPKVLAEFFSKANRDSEYARLLDSDPAHLWSKTKIQKWIEDEKDENPPHEYFFTTRTLDGDQLIGFVTLIPVYSHGDAWLAIAIGDRAHWNKGYGTEMMQLILRYAFDELNIHRVTLAVFDYNQRAFRTYQKVGFKPEGTMRGMGRRTGQRYDMHMMGILRDEWQAGRAL